MAQDNRAQRGRGVLVGERLPIRSDGADFGVQAAPHATARGGGVHHAGLRRMGGQGDDRAGADESMPFPSTIGPGPCSDHSGTPKKLIVLADMRYSSLLDCSGE